MYLKLDEFLNACNKKSKTIYLHLHLYDNINKN